MINGERVLAVIPARGGSKRCPMKNLRPFKGKPLFRWTIEAAKASSYIDVLQLSTDDKWIRAEAERFCTAIMRPPELATDAASNEDVLRERLVNVNFSWVVLLQPTSPLRQPQDIDNCIEIATEGHACISYRPDGTKNGAVYVARSAWLLEGHNFSEDTLRYIMPSSRSLDIDYPEQFE